MIYFIKILCVKASKLQNTLLLTRFFFQGENGNYMNDNVHCFN